MSNYWPSVNEGNWIGNGNEHMSTTYNRNGFDIMSHGMAIINGNNRNHACNT